MYNPVVSFWGGWRYLRIVSKLKKLGILVSKTSVVSILRRSLERASEILDRLGA